MKQRVVFTFTGGFPVTQELFDFMQAAYKDIGAGIAALCGDKCLLGVTQAGAVASAGWLTYNGELLPFEGGNVTGKTVNIVETALAAKTFADNVDREVYYTKKAVLGVGGAFPFTDCINPYAVKNIWQRFDTKDIVVNAAYFAANFDGTGLGTNEREGWAWCNGQNGTPDLRGRVKVNHSDADGSFDLQDAGGEKEHQLINAELPVINLGNFWRPGGVQGGESGSDNLESTNVTFGGGQAHNNLQPYYTVLTIMKL
jgi:hypothetical protein